MSRQPDLSVAEIEALLFAGLLASQVKTQELNFHVKLVSGIEQSKNEPGLADIQANFNKKLCTLLAPRLKANDYSVPLVTPEDFSGIIPTTVNEIAELKGEAINENELAQITEIFKVMFEYFFEDMIALQQVGLNQYQGQWRIFEIAFDIAAERQMTATEVFSAPATYDELVRRLYTRDEYLAVNLNKHRRSCNVETLKKIILEPQLKLLGENNFSKEEIDEIRQEFERDLTPLLTEGCEKMKLIIEGWFLMEAERIYKPS